MGNFISKAMNALFNKSQTETPAVVVSDDKIGDVLSGFKQLTQQQTTNQTDNGLSWIFGTEDKCTVHTSISIHHTDQMVWHKVIPFIMEKSCALLTEYDKNNSFVTMFCDSSSLHFNVMHAKYSTFTKYLDIILEVNRVFGTTINKTNIVQISREHRTTHPIVGVVLFHTDEGYYEIVGLDYLTSLHQNKKQS